MFHRKTCVKLSWPSIHYRLSIDCYPLWATITYPLASTSLSSPFDYTLSFVTRSSFIVSSGRGRREWRELDLPSVPHHLTHHLKSYLIGCPSSRDKDFCKFHWNNFQNIYFNLQILFSTPNIRPCTPFRPSPPLKHQMKWNRMKWNQIKSELNRIEFRFSISF